MHFHDGWLLIKTGQIVFENMKVKGNAMRRVVMICLIFLFFLQFAVVKKRPIRTRLKKSLLKSRQRVK
jgi:hypothetical protein